MTLNEKIERLCQLARQRESIDKEIETLLGGDKPLAAPRKYKARTKSIRAKSPRVKNERKAKVKITKDIIDQISYLRDEEGMTSKQIAEELNISLSSINRYYRPLSSERGIQ